MLKINKIFYCLIILILGLPSLGAADLNFSVGNETVKSKETIKNFKSKGPSDKEYYDRLVEASKSGHRRKALKLSTLMLERYPFSPLSEEVFYLLGLTFYQSKDFEVAERYLNLYVKQNKKPQFFCEAMKARFNIAETFKEGKKKHLRNNVLLPKIISGKDDALRIYDDIIKSFPQEELVIRSLLGKGQLLNEKGDYTTAIETYQILIKQFPNSIYTPYGHAGIIKTYLIQAQKKHTQSDYLDLSLMQLRQFKQSFSSHACFAEIEDYIKKIQEIYAKEAYKTAQFYEKLKKPGAAQLYYNKILKMFPNSSIAQKIKIEKNIKSSS